MKYLEDKHEIFGYSWSRCCRKFLRILRKWIILFEKQWFWLRFEVFRLVGAYLQNIEVECKLSSSGAITPFAPYIASNALTIPSHLDFLSMTYKILTIILLLDSDSSKFENSF
jgi:hypothetical protein